MFPLGIQIPYYIIQNIPDDEVAYHAGDCLTDIGKNGIYLGGGNKNGIGILVFMPHPTR